MIQPRSPVIGVSKPLFVPTPQFNRDKIRPTTGFLTDDTKYIAPEYQKTKGVLATSEAGLGPILTTGINVGTGSGQLLRANRFTPTPWNEVYGSAVRYKLPITLNNKIRAALTQFVTPN